MNNKDKIHALSRAVIIDQGHILLCRTLDLKINFYFLPGGHIEHEESAKESLCREIMEETGCSCEIKRFLGCLEYSFKPGHNSICHNHEYNFIFEVQGVDLKLDKNISSPEKQIELVWKPLDQLSKIDFRAEPLRLLIPKWLSGNSDLFQSKML